MISTHTLEAILTAKDKGFTSTLDKASKTTQRLMDKFSSGLGFGAWMAIGQRAVNMVFSSITSNMDGAIKRFDTLNNFPKVMQSLGFSADEANASIDKLANNIDHLPTTLDAVSSQTQQFVAIMGDIDEATDLTLALNNAMAAGGAPAEQQAAAINQWTQAMAKGKPDLQDWRALVQTAPAQMNQLAEATLGAGKTQQDLYKALQDGSVTMDEVNKKMIELSKNGGDGFASWEEQAKSAGGGINMAMVNIKAAVQRNIANVLKSLDKMLEKFGGISGFLQRVIDPINSVGDAISGMLEGKLDPAEVLSGFIDGITAKLPDVLAKGSEIITNLINGIGTAMPKILNSGIKLILTLVKGIAANLPRIIVAGAGLILDFVSGIVRNLPQVLKVAVQAIGEFVKGIVQGIPTVYKKLDNLAGEILILLGKALLGIVKVGVNVIADFYRGIAKGFSTLFSKLRGLASRIPSIIKNAIKGLYSIGSNIVKGIWSGIKAQWDSMVARLKQKVAGLPTAVKKVLGIASPSKVFMKIGAFVGEGMALGIMSAQHMVEDATLGLVSTPSVAMAQGLNTDVEYGVSARYDIVVPLEINGKEFARATASDMQTQINKNEKTYNRKLGYR